MKGSESILCSAIWYKDWESKSDGYKSPYVDSGTAICAMRHDDCIRLMRALTGRRTVFVDIGVYEQGFITTKRRFVSREEGLKIAIEAGQVKEGRSNRLYSEDIWSSGSV